MSPKKTYVAVYDRDLEDDAWNVHIKGLDGCQTYGRSLRQAQARIRQALGLWLDRDPQTLLMRDELPASLSAVAETVTRARREAERAGMRAQEETTRAVNASLISGSADVMPPNSSESLISAFSNSGSGWAEESVYRGVSRPRRRQRSPISGSRFDSSHLARQWPTPE